MSLDGHLTVTVTDDAATFEFVIENASTESVELTFPSGQVADAVVYPGDAEGMADAGTGDGATGASAGGGTADPDTGDTKPVWRWSDGRMFTQALETTTLGPEEQFTEELSWENPPSGAYTAEASLQAIDASVATRASFTVP